MEAGVFCFKQLLINKLFMSKESEQEVNLNEETSGALVNSVDHIVDDVCATGEDQSALENKDELEIEAEVVETDKHSEQETVTQEQQSDVVKDKRPSILYCVPANLLDITSGAALSQRTLMASLVKKGFRSIALEATVFDSAHGGEHILKACEQQPDKKILRSNVFGVEHIIIRTEKTRRGLMTCNEQEIYLKRFREEIKYRRPDMIFMWGGMLLEMVMMREAREAGIPVIFYLVNGGYKNIETFKYVSLIVTDTQATADLYKERHDLNLKVVGKFIDVELIKPKVPRRPDFITFINPSFEKGISVFMPMAKILAKEAPEIRLLVVQSRGRWGNALKILGFKPEDFPNVKVIGHQTDMRPVYASTRALLLPSLWHESGARVVAEAQLNGIPILGSNTGGTAELIGQGGCVFDIPEDVRENKTKLLVKEENLRPWIEEIKRIWHDQDYYNALVKKVEEEAIQHDLNLNTERFLKAVGPVVLESKGLGPDGKPKTNTKQTVAGQANLLQTALAKKQANNIAKAKKVKANQRKKGKKR